MIERCFRVFDGIGAGRERAIHETGITCWREFLDAGDAPGLSPARYAAVARQIATWARALERRDARFFSENLTRREHWLLFERFGDAVRYLDIETTGLSANRDDVTMVGLHDGKRYRALIRGQDLTGEALALALADCKLLVTYYGSSFDVPFLAHKFPGVRWSIPHLDLCFAARRVGLTGGLKSVERQLGLVRDDAIADVDGYEAVRLWRHYQRGNAAALQTLIEYNEADTVNLAHVARVVYERLCAQH